MATSSNSNDKKDGERSEIFMHSTQISTGFECDNCYIIIDSIEWKRCNICHRFDLCRTCVKAAEDNKDLQQEIEKRHKKLQEKCQTGGKMTDMKNINFEEATKRKKDDFVEVLKNLFNGILNGNKIHNDLEMGYVMDKLKEDLPEETRSKLITAVGEYYTEGRKADVKILCLDGGGKMTNFFFMSRYLFVHCYLFIGTRGYMSMKVLEQLLISTSIGKDVELDRNNDDHKKLFKQGQSELNKTFDYFVGTSTGGLIAFCLAVNYDIHNIMKLYEEPKKYFNYQVYFKDYPIFHDKYYHTEIHNEIDRTIKNINLNPENATLHDIHNLLNPKCQYKDETSARHRSCHSNIFEFAESNNNYRSIQREKVLLITAYNTSKNTITVFNTSYAEHWDYRIADVLKATMAAPTYFKPHEMWKGKKEGGDWKPYGDSEIFIDGGVFANDPELAALWAVRMQWKKPVNYHLLSIGTGTYNAKVSVDNWSGGYRYWLMKNSGLLINMFMDSTRSLTETVMNNLAKFDNITRMKFNYNLKKSMELDDLNFPKNFDDEWKELKKGSDFDTLVYFYKKCIKKEE